MLLVFDVWLIVCVGIYMSLVCAFGLLFCFDLVFVNLIYVLIYVVDFWVVRLYVGF